MLKHRALIMSFFASSTIPTGTPTTPQLFGSPRAALLVYRHLLGRPHFLLISTRRNPDRLTLPGGKVDAHETALQSAIRETQEEAGVLTDWQEPLGTYLHQKSGGRVHHTEVFLARYAGYQLDHEPRALHWLTLNSLYEVGQSIRQPIREQIESALEVLPAFTAAA
ncbi:MAG: NUDIX hydrolase [Planctomycetota bacterium]